MMVRIELLKLTEEEAVYKYFPEQEKEKYGIVAVNRSTGKRSIRQKLEEYTSEYAFQACRQIERYIAKGDFKTSGMIAWYENA